MWTQSINLRKITELKNQRQTDQLLIEKESNIYLNNTFITTLNHSPQFEKEMALGYLISSKKIGYEFDDIKINDTNIYVTASDKKLEFVKISNLVKPDKSIIFEITAYFQQEAILFKKTAITESAAFANKNSLLINSEDLSQEIAFYKLLGRYVMQQSNLDFSSVSLLISAKLDVSLIKKIAILGIGLIISRTAPTKQALEFAANYNICVVGFARGRRFNWYIT